MLNKTKIKNQKLKTTSFVCATALALCLYAPEATAFGGLGILGHKSNHKGGVNAIGVHIDANNTQKPNIEIVDEGDSQEPAETCAAERQCGDVCCGLYNVCVDGNKCCWQDTEGNVDETLCCDTAVSLGGGTGEGEFMTDWDEFEFRCCGFGSRLTVGQEDEHKADCCPADSPGVCDEDDCDGQGSRCCPVGTIILRDDEDMKHCCPPDSTGYGVNPETWDEQCCEPGTVPVSSNRSSDKFCCPEGTIFDELNTETCI